MAPAPDDQTDTDSSCDDDVLIGPDLNPGRSALDKKVYRQIILKKSGLRAILISDTLAMGQQHDHGNYEDDSGYESDSSSVEEDDGGGDGDGDGDGSFDGSEEEEDHDEGIRKAAAALVVRAGSFHDPLSCQGMAHFLEHMLFMGTDKYPSENAYDAFLQKNGGSDNAYTELEHTLYHFEISQEKLFDAMDMFAQFFVSPLLLPDAVERELNSIESEYQLSLNADECRLQQLLCHTGKAGADHPFGKFSWGNIRSLKQIPEENHVDVMAELRKFYDQFYFGSNMRLVVIGAFSLDQLQEQVVRCFSDVPALPREPSPLQMKLANGGTWEESSHSPIKDFGMPFSSSDLGRIYRIVPVKDRHSLSITWQIPPQQNWKSKPADYIAHLLGHEASGSLLSALKEHSWANACYAGVGSGGYENASSHALFTMTFILSEEGVSHWMDIVSELYKYIGIFNYHCHSPEGLPSWIFDELKAIQSISHKFQDEKMPEELVEEIAEDSLCDLPPDRLLDGNSLLFEFDGEAIKDLLDNYFVPSNSRIDLMSSKFGQDSEYDDESTKDCSSPETANPSSICASSDFPLETAGEPQKEPNFGTRYWCQTIAEEVLAKWSGLGTPQPAPTPSVLSLPPVNPFIPTKFGLKQFPPEDSDHPLIHCSLKVCVSVGREKSWFPASVIEHNKNKGEFLLSFEDEDKKWHKLDSCPDEAAANIKPGFEGIFDKSTKFKVLAVPRDGEGITMKYEDDSGCHVDVEGGVHFPAIPPPSSDTRLPQIVSNTQGLKMWHLQDRKFKRPIAELRMKIVCADANKSPFHRACSDLFVILCNDAVTETSYLASICELGSSIGVTDVGFTIRIHGFDHKLLELASEMLRVFFSFCGSEEEGKLPPTIKAGRFEQCLQMLLRNYANAGMQASRFCTDIRLRCLRPTIWSASAKADSLQDISVSSFRKVISNLFGQVSVEAFYHGNVELSDARAAEELIKAAIASSRSSVLPKTKFPTQPVIKAPLTVANHNIIAPTKDANEPNTAVEVYFQIGPDDATHRVLIDLLAHILYEPLFDQLRTKEQFGYSVSCGARWTYGVIGMSFKVVTSCKSAQEASERIDDFLLEFREELASMQHDAFLENLVGLAKNKLQMFNSLEEECGHYWSEIVEGRYEWEIYRNEAVCLRGITKEQLVAAYDEWLLPKCPAGKERERRRLAVHVIGSSEGPASLGRPQIDPEMLEKQVDESVSSFHKDAGSAIWKE